MLFNPNSPPLHPRVSFILNTAHAPQSPHPTRSDHLPRRWSPDSLPPARPVGYLSVPRSSPPTSPSQSPFFSNVVDGKLPDPTEISVGTSRPGRTRLLPVLRLARRHAIAHLWLPDAMVNACISRPFPSEFGGDGGRRFASLRQVCPSWVRSRARGKRCCGRHPI